MGLRVSGGEARGRKIKPARGIRPTSGRVKNAIFSMVGAHRIQGARVLDLYAGTGALGIEALSRGAAFAVFVEQSRKRCALIRENLKATSFQDRAHVYTTSVERALARIRPSFHLVLMDPPYNKEALDRVLHRLGTSPLVQEGGWVVVEHYKLLALEENYGTLTWLKEHHYGDTHVAIYQRGMKHD